MNRLEEMIGLPLMQVVEIHEQMKSADDVVKFLAYKQLENFSKDRIQAAKYFFSQLELTDRQTRELH